MGNELIGGRSERGMTRRGAILRPIDITLRVFDTNAHGKGFLREGYAMFLEELKYVAGGVAAGKDKVLRGDLLSRGMLRRLDIDARDGAGRVGANVNELCSIADDTSKSFDALGNIGDYCGKDVGANVRLGIPQNVSGCARFDEGVQDKAMGGIFSSRIELAIRESPRAAQAKLDIALGVEDALIQEEVDCLRAAKRRIALLDEQGLQTCFGEGKCGEKAGASGTDDDGALFGCAGNGGGE